jgi:allophanate hydrolase
MVHNITLNSQLTKRSIRLLRSTHTAENYHLNDLPGTTPPKSGWHRVVNNGTVIDNEVWDMPPQHVGDFLALIPSPLGLGKQELFDGPWVAGFICEGHTLDTALNMTSYDGWRT